MAAHDLVVVATFNDRPAADVAMSALEAARDILNIPAKPL